MSAAPKTNPVPPAIKNGASTLVIDGHYLLHRTMRVKEFQALTDQQGRCTGGVVGVARMVCAILTAYPTLHRVVYIWDSGLSKRRRSIYPAYKEQRTSQKPKEERTEDEVKYQSDFAFNRKYVTFLLSKLGCKVLEAPGKEGDDLVGFVVREWPEAHIVLSEDKDLYQLVSDRCHVYRPSSGQYVTPETFQEVAGYTRHTYLLARTILGDKSDNIDGIKGSGDKAAQEILKAVPPGSMDQMIESIVAYCKTAKLARISQVGMPSSIETIRRNLRLMDLSAEEFSDEERALIRGRVDAAPVFDRAKVTTLLQSIDARTMLADLGTWTQPFERLR